VFICVHPWLKDFALLEATVLGADDTILEAAKTAGRAWHYAPPAGHWDEALRPSGYPRRHWRRLALALRRLGFEQLSRRWQIGQQLIGANGVTYNVYGDPQGKERPWQMDPIPLVIDSGEWAGIERAIGQRAALLNLILADLYGAQRLMADRRLPPELIFANPHFLHPCHGFTPPGGVYLQNYAADLARSPDGRWWVISDRTQAPSGLGYALENRLVSARTLPSVFNRCEVRPLTAFFERTLGALVSLAPPRAADPRIVLLTPGPHNETYFEHSFLARHWGVPLVEGADLTVRDNWVFLKTLAGLETVDLILRRMDDVFCDPLELRGDSLLGVPGLVEAARAGNVAIANALGSGLAEAPCLMAFLPGLCRHLLGEDLRMPSVATWWCGQELPRRYVIDHLEDLVIKPAFALSGQQAEFPANMDQAARADLARRIAAEPWRYVAQEQVELSTCPIRTDEGLEARHVVLRALAAWDGASYSILPGGLTRVATADRSLAVSMQMGGGSKDTWVLGRRETEPSDSQPAGVPMEGRRSSGELPSRAADNLFWLGRYAERLEHGARLVRALLPGLSGEGDLGNTVSLETVIHLLGGLGFLSPDEQGASIAQQRWNLQRVMGLLVFDPSRTSGLGWYLKQIRHLSWQLKERFSQDTWRVLQQLENDFSRTPPATPEQRFVAAMNLLDGAVITLSAFAGLSMENTTRGQGWRFLDIGRRLERALETCALLRVGIAQAPFNIEPYLAVLLEIADSSITYRTRYLTKLRTESVLELLVADEANPRSAGFQLCTLADRVEKLPAAASDAEPLERALVNKALASVRGASMDDLATRDRAGDLWALDGFLSQLRTDLFDFSDALTARYLSHLAPSRLAVWR